MRRTTIILLLCAASSLAAQFPRGRPSAEPGTWADFGIGISQGFDIDDGSTNSSWQFGTGTQYVVALDRTMEQQSSLGVTATFGKLPLRYFGGPCGSCDADANVTQILGHFHYGSGLGFHQVFELGLGATIFSNFRERASGVQIGPTSDADLSFRFSYGFGFGLTPGSELAVLQ